MNLDCIIEKVRYYIEKKDKHYALSYFRILCNRLKDVKKLTKSEKQVIKIKVQYLRKQLEFI
jgi:uncharacterized protein (UPF0305 family)